MKKINPLTAAVVGGVVGAAGAAAAATLMDKSKRGELGKNMKDVIQQGTEMAEKFNQNKGTQSRRSTSKTSRTTNKKA